MKRMLSMILSIAMTLAMVLSPAMILPADALEPDGIHMGSYLSNLFPVKDEDQGQKYWLPDPCNLLGTEAEYVTSYAYEGVQYDMYGYLVTCDTDRLVEACVDYAFAVMELGYHVTELEEEDFILYYNLSIAGSYAELAVSIYDDGGRYDPNGVVTWAVFLAVPEDLSFTPGRETPGVVNGHRNCPGCEGSGRCQGCGGTGRDNYGAGYETCVVCDGARYCNICDGVGY